MTGCVQGGGQRTMKSDFKEKRDNVWTDYRAERFDHQTVGYRKSEVFEDYYKKQGVCPDSEWDKFVAILQTPLPITFRINGSSQVASELRSRLETDFFSKFTHDGTTMMLEGAHLSGELRTWRRPRSVGSFVKSAVA